MYFNGTNRYDSDINIVPGSPGTVMYWMWTNSITGTHRCVGAGNYYETRMIDDDLYHEYFQLTEPIATDVLTTDWWHHYAYVWDASGNKGIYKDGALLIKGTYTLGTPATTKLSLGASYWSAGTEQLDGELDDVRIYDRLMELEEIQTVYNAHGADGIVEGLLHRWGLRSERFGVGSATEKDERGALNMSATPGNPTVSAVISRMRRG